jgi:hypothetical protein
MALGDLDRNNPYTRPSSLISDVSSYLGPNAAQLPLDMTQGNLGSMMSPTKGSLTPDEPDIYDPDDDGGITHSFTKGSGITKTQPPTHEPGADIFAPKTDLLTDFFQKLTVLTPEQRTMMMGMVGTTGGDKTAGMSKEEYAELFGLSEDYAHRFQGYPFLANLPGEIQNIHSYRAQQRGFEQRAVQQAQVQAGGRFQGGMGFGAFGRGGVSSAMRRRSLMDTLKQRQSAVEESFAGKYSQLVSTLQNRLSSGFGVAGDILKDNPEASLTSLGNIRTGQTRVAGDGNLEYWDGSTWVDRETYLRNLTG